VGKQDRKRRSFRGGPKKTSTRSRQQRKEVTSVSTKNPHKAEKSIRADGRKEKGDLLTQGTRAEKRRARIALKRLRDDSPM